MSKLINIDINKDKNIKLGEYLKKIIKKEMKNIDNMKNKLFQQVGLPVGLQQNNFIPLYESYEALKELNSYPYVREFNEFTRMQSLDTILQYTLESCNRLTTYQFSLDVVNIGPIKLIDAITLVTQSLELSNQNDFHQKSLTKQEKEKKFYDQIMDAKIGVGTDITHPKILSVHDHSDLETGKAIKLLDAQVVFMTKYKRLAHVKHNKNTILHYPEGKLEVLMQSEEMNNVSHATIREYTRRSTPQIEAVSPILTTLVDKKVWNELRTVKQLGYIVFAFASVSGGMSSFKVMVQGEKEPPDQVAEAIDEGMIDVVKELKTVSDESILLAKESILQEYRRQPVTFGEEYSKYLSTVLEHRYDFDRSETLANILDNMSIIDIRDLLINHMCDLIGINDDTCIHLNQDIDINLINKSRPSQKTIKLYASGYVVPGKEYDDDESNKECVQSVPDVQSVPVLSHKKMEVIDDVKWAYTDQIKNNENNKKEQNVLVENQISDKEWLKIYSIQRKRGIKLETMQFNGALSVYLNIYKRYLRQFFRQNKRDGWFKLNKDRLNGYKGEIIKTNKGNINIIREVSPFSVASVFKESYSSYYYPNEALYKI
eukprot:GHVR01012906.1.p1 GENE.GHVR01012906.1~~GHVR01012906.1.p1  ORF type:complete len:666 (+),score=157.89 GHVR01012906.1:201-2000(+)